MNEQTQVKQRRLHSQWKKVSFRRPEQQSSKYQITLLLLRGHNTMWTNGSVVCQMCVSMFYAEKNGYRSLRKQLAPNSIAFSSILTSKLKSTLSYLPGCFLSTLADSRSADSTRMLILQTLFSIRYWNRGHEGMVSCKSRVRLGKLTRGFQSSMC